MRGKTTAREEVKLSLLTDSTVVHLKDPTELTGTHGPNKHSKIADTKSIKKNSSLYLCEQCTLRERN